MNIHDVLVKYGVGKRSPDDQLFNSNKLLSKMSEKIGICDIDKTTCPIPSTSIKCQVPGCFLGFENLIDYECHYNSVHRYMCCECRKNLPSSHLLDLHVSETHDSFFAVMAEKTPSYACYLETCQLKFCNQNERMEHCITDHKFPPNFRFDTNINKNRNKKQTHKKSKNKSESSMEIDKKNCSSEQKPKIREFNFSHSRVKAFAKPSEQKCSNTTESKLESEDFLLDLKHSLPDC